MEREVSAALISGADLMLGVGKRQGGFCGGSRDETRWVSVKGLTLG
jgi:hypothetical protein